jgi:voltage-gated potassium channel
LKWLRALWPQWPLALVLALVGVLNILDGLSLPLNVLQRIHALHGLAESLSAVGGTAQVILGLMLFVAGVGLLRRLSFAWTLAFLLLLITAAVNVAQKRWGVSLALQGVMLTALLLLRRHFLRRTALASMVFSLTSIGAILAYGMFGAYLLGPGFRPEIHDLHTAFYFTIITLSTVGYGDIVPVTPEARWFVVSLLVVGLGVFASAIASALGPKISGELNRLFNPKEKHMEPKAHVILVGHGAIARNTAQELKRRRVQFVRIVAAGFQPESPGERTIEGDATNDATLQEAGIEQARLVIAALEDDGDNAFIALGAKDLNPKVRVLAVASSPLSIRRLKLARADLVFSPAAVGSRLLADLVEGNEIQPEFRDLLEGEP